MIWSAIAANNPVNACSILLISSGLSLFLNALLIASIDLVASEVASSGNHIKKEHIIIGLFIVAAVIAVIIIIKMNKGGKDEEEYDYNDDFEDDNNINNNSNDNFIEDLYKRRNDGQRLNKFEEETIEDIEKENDRIFNKPKKGEIYDYDKETENDNNDDFLDELSKRSKGKHF